MADSRDQLRDLGAALVEVRHGRRSCHVEQEIEQRPCAGAKSSEGKTFQTGFRTRRRLMPHNRRRNMHHLKTTSTQTNTKCRVAGTFIFTQTQTTKVSNIMVAVVVASSRWWYHGLAGSIMSDTYIPVFPATLPLVIAVENRSAFLLCTTTHAAYTVIYNKPS